MVVGNYIHIVGLQIWWMKATRITWVCIWPGVDIHVVCYSDATLHQPVTLISEPLPCFDSPVFITKHDNNSAQRGDHKSNSANSPAPPLTWQSDANHNSKRDSDTFAEIHPAFSQRAHLDGDQLWNITRTTVHVPTDAVSELVEPTRNVWIRQKAKFRPWSLIYRQSPFFTSWEVKTKKFHLKSFSKATWIRR